MKPVNVWDKPLYMFPVLWRFVDKLAKMGEDIVNRFLELLWFGRKRDIGRQGFRGALVY